jgi:type II secretory pathway component PulF
MEKPFFRNASIVTLVLIVGMCVLSYAMRLRMEYYAHSGLYIPLFERILFGVSAFWRSYWWILIYVVAGIGLASAGIIELVLRKD